MSSLKWTWRTQPNKFQPPILFSNLRKNFSYFKKKKKKSRIQTKNLRPFGKIDKSVQPKMFYAKLTKRNFHAD